MSATTLHPDQLVDAFDDAETTRYDHYAICDDQRDEIGCSICDRNMDRLRAAERAMKANPLAMLIHNSEARRAQRREAARVRSADFRDDEHE
jgi:hypothetical protein